MIFFLLIISFKFWYWINGKQKDEAEAGSIDEMRNWSLSNMAKCLLISLQERCRPCLPDANCLCPGTLALQTSELQPYPDTMDCSPAAELHRWPIALTPRRELRNLQQPRYTGTIFLIFITQNVIKFPNGQLEWLTVSLSVVFVRCEMRYNIIMLHRRRLVQQR